MVTTINAKSACRRIQMSNFVQSIPERKVFKALSWENSVLAHLMSHNRFCLFDNSTYHGSFCSTLTALRVELPPNRQR